MAKLKERKKYSYYDFSKLLSHNAVYNFCVGARGLGKTYGAKKLVIRAFIRRGEQFVWLRRYKTELATRGTFFDDIRHEFPQYGFRVAGFEAQICLDPRAEKPEWHTMGFFVALSIGQALKGKSFHDVTTIVYDEFIIEKGTTHYLPKEDIVFNNFYSTVDRWQDKTKVLFLANSVSIMNPYFMSYKIKPNKEWVIAKDGFIVAHFANSREFANEVKETRYGKFISGTEYEEYAVNSVFADAHEYLVARKTADAHYFITLETSEGIFSIWRTPMLKQDRYFVQSARPKQETILTTEPEYMAEGKIYIPSNDKILQYLRAAYGRGHVMFDGPETRNMFAVIFKR